MSPSTPSSSEPNDGRAITPDVPPSALTPAAPDDPDASKLSQILGERPDVRTMALVGLFLLAALYTLHIARAFLLPIAVALLLDFLLSPVVRWLRKFRIPSPVGAGLVMILLLGAIAGTGYYLAGPAAAWIQRAPGSMDQAKDRIAVLRRPVDQVTRAAEEVEEAADVSPDATPEVKLAGPTVSRRIFGGTMAMLGFFAVVIFLTFFLLAAGDLFLQKLIKVLPQFRDKKRAVVIAREIEEQISRHMVTVTGINIGVAVVTAGAMKLCGLPNPILWGVVAGLLNFMPYIGAVVTIGLLAMAALVTFDSVAQALLVPGAFMALNILEGNLITPAILGRRLQLNTVALFMGMTFWWFIWGIPGALMAVPIMATIKIICDRFEALTPVGEFLGK